MYDYDLLVIGSGPAGEKGAVEAATFGKRVAVVEEKALLGGAAANTGTLPSKTLRETALYLSGFERRNLYGVTLRLRREVTLQDLMFRKLRVSEHERERIRENFLQHDVEVLRGKATFADAHTVSIRGPEGAERRVTAECFLVATGSSPRRPPLYPFEDPRVHDSDELLDIQQVPESLAIIGGGVIGCEYACIFAALGIPVTLVEQRPGLLSFLDAELSVALRARMEAMGVRFALPDAVESFALGSHRVAMTLQSGGLVETHEVLVAAGRTGNTAGLGLEPLGVVLESRGRIQVDPHYRTAVPHIFAAGDVVGSPALASTSMEQARIAVHHAFEAPFRETLPSILPYGVYTIPEVSMAGETEESLRAKGERYLVGRASFATNARGEINGDEHGLLKLLFQERDLRLLGVHVIGESASELVHVGLMALMLRAHADLFVRTCFNYPTLSAAYKTATFDALQRRSSAGKREVPNR